MKKLPHNECLVLQSSNLIFFDIDDTLILWDSYTPGRSTKIKKSKKTSLNPNLRGRLEIEDPNIPGHYMSFIPHIAHCHILMRNFQQGRTIVVWSAAGHAWAYTVIKALGLEKYVTLILDKPSIIVDDIPMEHWKPKTIYLKNDTEGV